jgi:hypothetical protein
MRTWLIAIMFAFGPLLALELHHWGERRRARRLRWAEQRAQLQSLREMHPGPRSIP